MASETEHPADGHVASHDSLPDLSPNERFPPQRGRAEPAGGPHLGAHPGRLALGNAGPRRAALGACHHAVRLALRARDAGHPSHAGEWGRRRPRQTRRILFRLDTRRARRDRTVLRHPFGPRTGEPATGPAPVVRLLAVLAITGTLITRPAHAQHAVFGRWRVTGSM